MQLWRLSHVPAMAALLGGAARASPVSASATPFVQRDAASPPPPQYTLIPSPAQHTGDLTQCKGYAAKNVQTHSAGLTATLELIGAPCHAYGERDYAQLTLTVHHDTAQRLHVLIADAHGEAPVIPEQYLPVPPASSSPSASAELVFSYDASPFAFNVTRRDSGEVLFSTGGAGPLVFEDQYVRIGTTIPRDANLYGLGEHNDPMRLPTSNYSRTLWNRDAGGLPSYTPLYGAYPLYHEHRLTPQHGPQTHGVLLRNAHGMKVDIDNGQLVFNALGGVLDLYFFAGPQPAAVTQQQHGVLGKPAGTPYWGLGAHNCRYGIRDVFEFAAIVQNYSDARIPLETAWNDIDLYDRRIALTTNPQLYPKDKYRQTIDWLHARGQRFIVMQDPALAARDNPTYRRGVAAGAFMKNWNGDGTPLLSVVWPGLTVFPDWTANGTQQWWNREFELFYGSDANNYTHTPVADEGDQPTLPIDGLWIDMSEPASFIPYLGIDLDIVAIQSGAPPVPPSMRAPPYEIPGLAWTKQNATGSIARRADELAYEQLAYETLAKRDLPPGLSLTFNTYDYPDNPAIANLSSKWLYPPYDINITRQTDGQFDSSNVGVRSNLSDRTVRTDVVHANGQREYDMHNLFGAMFEQASYHAMLARRPNKKPFIINRSTFLGVSRFGGHWLGDNIATEKSYIQTVRNMLNHAYLGNYLIGSDIGGFQGNSTEALTARWAGLAVLSPFYRVHSDIAARPHYLYVWPNSTRAGQVALDRRYRLLDAMYTAFHLAEMRGQPALLEPIWWRFPNDSNTFALEQQYFALDGAVLVSPVVDVNSSSVDAFMPDARFYTFDSWEPLEGKGAPVTFDNLAQWDIPMHVRGGAILPMRNESAMLTRDVRKKPFVLVVAPDRSGRASGQLYLDDGESIKQESYTYANFTFADNTLTVDGTFDYTGEGKANIEKVLFLGQPTARTASIGRSAHNATAQTITVSGISEYRPFTVKLG